MQTNRIHQIPVFLITWIVVFLFFALTQFEFIDIPVYWDARLYWDQAKFFAQKPWLPFVFEYDPGHPPLMSWLVGLLWQLPVPRIPAWHVLTWIFSSLFATCVIEATRLTFGWMAAIGAGLLSIFHPTVYAQAVTMNLDMYLAASMWLGVYATVRGKPVVLALACIGMAMFKLNGMSFIGIFLIWSYFRVLSTPSFRNWRGVLTAFWPPLTGLVVFAIYHLIKFYVTGHVFDTGEMEAGKQTQVISNPDQFVYRIYNNFKLMMNYNGNWYVIGVLLPITFLFGTLLCFEPFRNRISNEWSRKCNTGENSEEQNRFWAPLDGKSLLILIWILFAISMLSQAVRLILTIERYFFIGNPTFYITFMAITCTMITGRAKVLSLILIIPLLYTFYLKWHPEHLKDKPEWLRERMMSFPDEVPNNYETTLEFTEYFRALERAVKDLNRHLPEGGKVAGWWPLDMPSIKPEFGISEVEYDLVYLYTQPPPETRMMPDPSADAVVYFRYQDFYKDPRFELQDRFPGFRLYQSYRKSRVWVNLYYRDDVYEQALARDQEIDEDEAIETVSVP